MIRRELLEIEINYWRNAICVKIHTKSLPEEPPVYNEQNEEYNDANRAILSPHRHQINLSGLFAILGRFISQITRNIRHPSKSDHEPENKRINWKTERKRGQQERETKQGY